jgi:hypothetical protein
MADAQVKAREGRGAWSLLKRFRDSSPMSRQWSSEGRSCCDAL